MPTENLLMLLQLLMLILKNLLTTVKDFEAEVWSRYRVFFLTGPPLKIRV